MRISENGLNLIKKFESFSSKVYPDERGLPTIGWGHLIKPNENFTEIDLTQAERLLQEDIQEAETCVNAVVKVDLTQNQFDALVSLCFNIGINAFKKSTMVRMLNHETS
jgi:lysozyme